MKEWESPSGRGSTGVNGWNCSETGVALPLRHQPRAGDLEVQVVAGAEAGAARTRAGFTMRPCRPVSTVSRTIRLLHITGRCAAIS